MSIENPFLPTSVKYDENRFIEDLQDDYFSVANAINQREVGEYSTAESVNGQLWQIGSARHSILRKIINTGTLPNTANKSVAHNITLNTNTFFTKIYGGAKAPATNVFIPLPFAAPVDGNNISLFISGANVVITTGSNRTNFTESYVIIEYWQS